MRARIRKRSDSATWILFMIILLAGVFAVMMSYRLYLDEQKKNSYSLIKKIGLATLAAEIPLKSLGTVTVEENGSKTIVTFKDTTLRFGEMLELKNLAVQMRNYRPYADVFAKPVETLAVTACEDMTFSARVVISAFKDMKERKVALNAEDACVGRVAAELVIEDMSEKAWFEVRDLMKDGKYAKALHALKVKSFVATFTPFKEIGMKNYRVVAEAGQDDMLGRLEQNVLDAMTLYTARMREKDVPINLANRNLGVLGDFIKGNKDTITLELGAEKPLPLDTLLDELPRAELK